MSTPEDQIPRFRTYLNPEEELRFRDWYRTWAYIGKIDPDPDHPLQRYDYRGAFKAGEEPQINLEDGLLHWPSRFKDPDHPNRFVSGRDTRAEDETRASGGSKITDFLRGLFAPKSKQAEPMDDLSFRVALLEELFKNQLR